MTSKAHDYLQNETQHEGRWECNLQVARTWPLKRSHILAHQKKLLLLNISFLFFHKDKVGRYICTSGLGYKIVTQSSGGKQLRTLQAGIRMRKKRTKRERKKRRKVIPAINPTQRSLIPNYNLLSLVLTQRSQAALVLAPAHSTRLPGRLGRIRRGAATWAHRLCPLPSLPFCRSCEPGAE
jgi:hypothetical protein